MLVFYCSATNPHKWWVKWHSVWSCRVLPEASGRGVTGSSAQVPSGWIHETAVSPKAAVLLRLGSSSKLTSGCRIQFPCSCRTEFSCWLLLGSAWHAVLAMGRLQHCFLPGHGEGLCSFFCLWPLYLLLKGLSDWVTAIQILSLLTDFKLTG